ncbi:hypothetical protein MIMGU_mgv11b0171931mg, partial [Erythranthe guttata]
CWNGHIACESCCAKMSKKCASCCLPIGSNRCRALEKVLESLRILCAHAPYGCSDLISYTDKHAHEKTCKHAPFYCPLLGCTYADSPQSVYSHFAVTHWTSVKFDFDRSFRVSFVQDQNHVFLQELDTLRIFVLSRFSENAGNYVSVTFIAPASSRREYFYNLTARCGARSIMVTSVAECTARWSAEAKAERFVVVPTDFLTSAGELELELTIWKLEALSLA